jgi:uncharacterized protein YdaU (DUF1376 family)
MSERPWMPLYIGDYLSKTSHLRAAQSGAYLHLLMHYWQYESLPDDDAQLASIARVTGSQWSKMRAVIQQFFYDGWKHKRVDEELAKANKISDIRRAAGSKCKTNATTNADQMPTQSQSPSQSHEGRKSPSGPTCRSPAKILFDQTVTFLVEHCGQNDRGARGLVGKWRGQIGDVELIALVSEAMRLEVMDLVPWMEAAIRRRKQTGQQNGQPTLNQVIATIGQRLTEVPAGNGGTRTPLALGVIPGGKAE